MYCSIAVHSAILSEIYNTFRSIVIVLNNISIVLISPLLNHRWCNITKTTWSWPQEFNRHIYEEELHLQTKKNVLELIPFLIWLQVDKMPTFVKLLTQWLLYQIFHSHYLWHYRHWQGGKMTHRQRCSEQMWTTGLNVSVLMTYLWEWYSW